MGGLVLCPVKRAVRGDTICYLSGEREPYSIPEIIFSYWSHHGMLDSPLAVSMAFSSFTVLAMILPN